MAESFLTGSSGHDVHPMQAVDMKNKTGISLKIHFSSLILLLFWPLFIYSRPPCNLFKATCFQGSHFHVF